MNTSYETFEKRRHETGKKSGTKRRSVDATDGCNESIKSDKYHPRIKYTDGTTAKGSDDEARGRERIPRNLSAEWTELLFQEDLHSGSRCRGVFLAS